MDPQSSDSTRKRDVEVLVFLYSVPREWGFNNINIGDSNPERVRGVKKTVRWTVFSHEVRSGYTARTEYACGGFIPDGSPTKHRLKVGAFIFSLFTRYSIWSVFS